MTDVRAVNARLIRVHIRARGRRRGRRSSRSSVKRRLFERVAGLNRRQEKVADYRQRQQQACNAGPDLHTIAPTAIIDSSCDAVKRSGLIANWIASSIQL